jgi:hypothetical protein
MNMIEGTFIHDDCDHAQPGGGRRVKNWARKEKTRAGAIGAG